MYSKVVSRVGALALCLLASVASAQINVITVDVTPMVSPGNTSFGMSNTMGMALQQADLGGKFNVTEVTPAAFQLLNAAQLAAYDLIAINNNPARIGPMPGLGVVWQGVIGVNAGGRVFLCSHDAPRFKMIVAPGSTCFTGFGPEPFGAIQLVNQAALWAGGGKRTGLLIFNDSVGQVGNGVIPGVGWNNPELNLPAAWGISDSMQWTWPTDGGYTDILLAWAGHPIYVGLNDVRLTPNSISSFAANIVDDTFHSVFATFNAAIFTPTEEIINAGVVDVGGIGAGPGGCGVTVAVPGPNGLAISLIRDELPNGACCDKLGNCTDGTQADCDAVAGGTYQGDGTDCATANCPRIIPTVSEWGLLAMILIGLTIGAVVFGKKFRVRNA